MFLTPLMASIAYMAEQVPPVTFTLHLVNKLLREGLFVFFPLAAGQEIYPTYSLFLNDTLALFDVMLPYHNKIKLVSGDIHQVRTRHRELCMTLRFEIELVATMVIQVREGRTMPREWAVHSTADSVGHHLGLGCH